MYIRKDALPPPDRNRILQKRVFGRGPGEGGSAPGHEVGLHVLGNGKAHVDP